MVCVDRVDHDNQQLYLRDGSLPSQKYAIVSPLLKKPFLDPAELRNYRPVSNLTFTSKVIERIVASQLTRYLQSNDLMPRMQSGYRKYHSTETALLRIMSDVYSAADERRVTLLTLLDLSAVFDCVDHDILLGRLQLAFGIEGSALAWLTSFLSTRTQRVYTLNSYQKSATSCLVYHKAPYWARCFSCSM